jgi:trigger factor
MQVSVEKTSELSRKMIVNIPEDVVQSKVDVRLKILAKDVKVDGFRAGKVPQKVVKKMYGARAREEVTSDLIQTNYFKALQDNELRPAGYPQIKPVKRDEGFEFVATFEVYPEFTLDAIDTIEISNAVATVGTEDIDAMILKLREQKKEWSISEAASKDGDQVTIKFSGVCEGQNFTDGTVNDFLVEIGSKRMIPGFEDQLVGLSVGATKTLDVTFPEQYTNQDLSGKPAIFEIEVLKIESSELPEVGVEFIKAYGIESGDAADFRADIDKNMQRELKQVLKTKLKNSVMDALYTSIEVALPITLIDQEVDSLMKPYIENAKKKNLEINDAKLAAGDFEEQAKRRVGLGLILAEVIQKNEIKAGAEAIKAVIDDLSVSYEKSEEAVNWYYGDEKRLAEIEQMVLEDAAVEWVLTKVKVIEKTISFSSVMESAA